MIVSYSERNTQRGGTAPRGWENDQAMMSRGKRKGARNDSDGEYPDMEGWEEADDEDDEESTYGDNDGDEEFVKGGGGKKIALRSSNQNDMNFEKTLEEYDEKELGYLSDVRRCII